MTPTEMLTTAALLGGFVLAGGAYGLLYCAARISERKLLRVGGYASYATLCLIAFALLAFTPLHLGWKVLIVASCAIYLMIPPMTWRHLTRLHREERIQCYPTSSAR
jgi:hypothetical protein